MIAIMRATLGRLLSRRPRRPELTWYIGERVAIAACDRRTGRPERPAVSFNAVVVNVEGGIVTTSADAGGHRRAYDFSAGDGWDTWAGGGSPWRIFHQAERWRL
jgi:hypothetical protein